MPCEYRILFDYEFPSILGVCICKTGFQGDECDIATTDKPDLSDILSGSLCDVRADLCESVIVNGINFVDIETLTCHFSRQDVSHLCLPGTVKCCIHITYQ